MNCQPNKNKGKGGATSHKFERIMYLKNTADEFNLNHKEFLARLKRNKFDCPMGWIRAQLLPVTTCDRGEDDEV